MTRTEFLGVYRDLKREGRGKPLSNWREAEAHAQDRHEAERLWRNQKNRLQDLTPEEWKKQEDRDARTR